MCAYFMSMSKLSAGFCADRQKTISSKRFNPGTWHPGVTAPMSFENNYPKNISTIPCGDLKLETGLKFCGTDVQPNRLT